MRYTSEMWIFILAAAIIMALLAVTWGRRHLPSGQAFLLLMLCALAWTITFTLEIAAQSLELKVLMVKLQYISITLMPLAWLYLTASYTGQDITRRGWSLLAVIPLISNMIIWLVPRPNWFWEDPVLVMVEAPLLLLHYDYGFWFYYVLIPYSYVLVFASLFMLGRTFFKTHPIYRHQMIVMMIAIILPVTTNLLYVLNISPIDNFNYTTAVFSISCLIIAWALFRYNFLDLLPTARDVVIDNMEDGVIVLDGQNRIVDANPAAMKIAGLTTRDIGKPVGEIRSKSISSSIKEISSEDKKHIEIQLDEAGERRVFDLRLSRIKDRAGRLQGSVITLRDCTERVNLFNQLQEQAIHDGLTGIYNRRQVVELGQTELNKLKRHPESSVSVIMMDLDNFKAINDKYGHAAGDQVLIAFAGQCKNCIRPYDIFGRLGGDEFVIILPDTTLEEAIVVARRIQSSIEKATVLTDQGGIPITVSLGIVSSRALDSFEHGLERLFNLADEQMYRSKKQGRNQVAYC